MPITPETRDRLTAGVAQLVRTGRQVSARAATQLYGELPSFGWAMLLPLERDGDQRCSALAAQVGVDVSVASRQLAVLERLGYVERRPAPPEGRGSPLRPTHARGAARAAGCVIRSPGAPRRVGARRPRRLGRVRSPRPHRTARPPGGRPRNVRP